MKTAILTFTILLISSMSIYAQDLSKIEEYEQRIANIDSLLKTKLSNKDEIKYLQENNDNKDSLIILLKSQNLEYIGKLEKIEDELTLKYFFFNTDIDVFDENKQNLDISELPRREREFFQLVKDIQKVNNRLNEVSKLIKDDSLSREELQNRAEQDMNDIDVQLLKLKDREQDMNLLLSDKQLDFYNRNVKERFNNYLERIY